MNMQRLCELAELDATGAKGVTLDEAGSTRELFVVRQDDQVFAYENCCPHTGGPLDWMPDQFLDEQRELIVCATHAALFRIHDGRCIAGPCAGARLRSVVVRLDGDTVLLNE